MNPPLPHPLPVFNITPEALIKSAEDLVDYIELAARSLAESASGDTTFSMVIHPLAAIDNEVKTRVQYMALFQAVSPSQDLRKASSAAVNLVDKTYLDLFQREDLFALVDKLHGDSSSLHSADPEDIRLLQRFHRMFIENGMKLTGSTRDRYTAISRRLIELRVAFMENLGVDQGYIRKPEQDLLGLGTDKLNLLAKDSAQGAHSNSSNTWYRIPLTKPMVNTILTQCRIPETRKEVFIHSQSCYQDNIEIFREVMVLRDEASRLLGFSSFAARKLGHQLIGSTENVEKLLEDLFTSLKPLAEQELQRLQAMANTDAPLNLWDFDFYHNATLRAKYDVDHELVAQYFPAKHTIRRMLEIFEEIFHLVIEKLDVTDNHVWHPDVEVFAVWEANKSVFIGYLYVDIYPREGKFSHAANFNIHPGYLDKSGNRATVATALVCNVSQGEPALLRHQEVITIFHELGHGMHDLVGKSKYAMFHGHRTVSDFSEAPSQLLEYWCWAPECLQKLSRHYSYISPEYHDHWSHFHAGGTVTQPPPEMPTSLIHNIVAAKQLDQGILTLRQVAFSKFDIRIHNPGSHEEIQTIDITELYNALLEQTTGLQGSEGDLRWENGYATTMHYIWGQEANYYSYLYTRILAAEIWYSHFQADPMSQEAGVEYRRRILNHGGSKDEWALLTDFLGRVPTPGAYLRDIGCES